jgi:Raf kinase inhibitor-like YbhB/YbcL family protein
MAAGRMNIVSPSFAFGERIPDRYTQSGEDLEPPLKWSGVPQGAEELALVCHDPDAPRLYGFTHWVVYGIAPNVATIGGEDKPAFVNGCNDYGVEGYRGPNPPSGHGTHSYYFFLIALDAELGLEPGLSRLALLPQLADHVIESARHVGTFSRL